MKENKLKEKKKIAIITTSLGKGGAEKTAALESEIFNSLGHDVTILMMHNIVLYDYKGKLINFGEKKYSDRESVGSKINKILKLKAYLVKNKFDLVVDNRMRSNTIFAEFIMSKYVYYNFPVAYVLNLNDFPKKLRKYPILLKALYKKAFKVITVSDYAKSKIESTYGFKNVTTIYNTFSCKIEEKAIKEKPDISYKYILYFGRFLESHKNLKFLINAYSKSLLPEKEIKLILLGEGEDKQMLVDEAKLLKCEENIVFIPFNKNPYPYVKNALFTVLTSHFEGFPLSLVESLACGIPIVSVDCKTGPSEIVINEFNGLLVALNDMEAYIKALNCMVTKMQLKELGINAKVSSEKFSQKEVSINWQSVINII